MAKCLVLGANGFVGSYLVDELAAAGHEVLAFDRFSSRQLRYQATQNVQQFAGDFLNRSDLAKAGEGVDYVFHLISTTTPASAEDDPLIDIETNVKMSIELFQECAKHRVKKVVFISTGGSIYGDADASVPLSEKTLPLPVSPYAIGKLTIEHYLRYFKRKLGLDSVVYRVSNPYGGRQSPTSRQGVIPIFLQHIANGEPLTVLGDGSMVRDYLYAGDVAQLITASFMQATQPVYNLGSGQGVSVNEIVSVVEQVTGQKPTIDHKPKPATFVDKVVLDTSLFEGEFNMRPQTDLASGATKTWADIKKQKA